MPRPNDFSAKFAAESQRCANMIDMTIALVTRDLDLLDTRQPIAGRWLVGAGCGAALAATAVYARGSCARPDEKSE
jgi:hypothetical protein